MRNERTLSEAVSYRLLNRTRRNHATFIGLAVAAYFRSQLLQFGTRLDELTLDNSDRIFDHSTEDVSSDRLTRAITLAYLAGMLFANKKYLLELAFDTNNVHVLQYERQHIPELLTQLADTSKHDIKDIITNGIDAELADSAKAKEIRALFVLYATERSALVGSYESLRAFNQGSYAAMQLAAATGVRYEKKWLTAGDDRVEQDCLDNEAQGWIGLTVVYNNGVECPPEHIGCRCGLDYRLVT